MDNLEDRLHQLPLAAPGPEFDERMDRLFDQAALMRETRRGVRIVWWQAAAMGLVCGMLGAVAGYAWPRQQPEPIRSTLVYIVPGFTDAQARAFDATAVDPRAEAWSAHPRPFQQTVGQGSAVSPAGRT